MSKGRNTTVVGVRLPDEVVKRLKSLARKDRLTMTELLKPVITDFAFNGHVGGVFKHSFEKEFKQPNDESSHSVEQKEEDIPAGFENNAEEIPDMKFKASPNPIPRNKARAKRKAKKKRH
jgi:hypothetical protein